MTTIFKIKNDIPIIKFTTDGLTSFNNMFSSIFGGTDFLWGIMGGLVTVLFIEYFSKKSIISYLKSSPIRKLFR